jgi:hypothetical protein
MITDKEEAKELLLEYSNKGLKGLKEARKKGELDDIVAEIADARVDIYNSDLLDWLREGLNYQIVEEAIDEMGFPTNEDGTADIIKAIQYGQYRANENLLHEAVEELLG